MNSELPSEIIQKKSICSIVMFAAWEVWGERKGFSEQIHKTFRHHSQDKKKNDAQNWAMYLVLGLSKMLDI
jgi:hypothetical protein